MSASIDHRIAAILGHPEADGRQKYAAFLAFETGMSVDEAGKHLAASNKSTGSAEVAAMAGASTARALLGMPPDPTADAEIGRRAAAFEAQTAAAGAVVDEAEWHRKAAEGRAGAMALLGKGAH
ncbi:hypothetical protein [Lichenifustis flavocetrariae]|uniref:Uncharacterized protein n=1 Tax=Lichenifustis flavocetrariae TaxID=2949735 RepID=A0AA42CNT1_9HYPH|nr:hypothetical protein [Lichenifustis flavocetrariae]MCW6509695.1 hypothetical protein [Lichenifustis flavocetrariae]